MDVNEIILSGVYEKVQRMTCRLLERYQGRDLGMPNKLIGVALIVIDKGIDTQECMYHPGKRTSQN